MNWHLNKSGHCQSLSNGVHMIHLSMISDDERLYTVYKLKPFENLGIFKNKDEAMAATKTREAA